MSSVEDIGTNSMLFHLYLIDSALTECERILNRIIEGDSDIDLSEDESGERIADTGEGHADEEQDVDDQDEEPDEADQGARPAEVDQDAGPAEVHRRPLWAKTNT